ncbi:hypothetical protein FACS1894187_14880 [Synergistales bacterium]|nr:hypothetical protein FACS1894187_14880 [Synergistales bacterium]
MSETVLSHESNTLVASGDISAVFEHYRKLNGIELTQEQKARLANLINTFRMQGIIEFQHIILTMEYYQSLNQQKFDKLRESLSKTEMSMDNLSKNVQSTAEKDEITANLKRLVVEIEDKLHEMEDKMLKAGGLSDNLADITGRAHKNFEKIFDDLTNMPAKVNEQIGKEKLSEKLVQIIEKEIESTKKSFRWYESAQRDALFLFLFSVAAMFFFLFGLLSHGVGLPPWITGVDADVSAIHQWSKIIFGLPMSWSFFVVIGFFAILWAFDHWEWLSESSSKMHFALALVIMFFCVLLCVWLLSWIL